MWYRIPSEYTNVQSGTKNKANMDVLVRRVGKLGCLVVCHASVDETLQESVSASVSTTSTFVPGAKLQDFDVEPTMIPQPRRQVEKRRNDPASAKWDDEFGE